MGKKTDAFTTNLQTYSDQSLDLTPKLITACQQVAKLFDQFSALETQHNARSSAIINKAGDDPTIFEPLIAKDPELTKLGTALDQVGKELMKARSDRESAKNGLKTVTAKLKVETAAFTTYITGKEKSKIPFKGKKSVPMAKGLIKAANDLIMRNEAILR
jgi:rubrerythrin